MFGLCSDFILGVTLSEWLDVRFVFQLDMACTEKRTRNDFLAVLRGIRHLDMSPWRIQQSPYHSFGDDGRYIRLIEGCPCDHLLWMKNRSMNIPLCVGLMEDDDAIFTLLIQYSERGDVFPFVDRLGVRVSHSSPEYIDILDRTINVVFPNAKINIYMANVYRVLIESGDLCDSDSTLMRLLGLERVQGIFWDSFSSDCLYELICCSATETMVQTFIKVIAPKFRAFESYSNVLKDATSHLSFLSAHCPQLCSLSHHLHPNNIETLLSFLPQLGQLRELSFVSVRANEEEFEGRRLPPKRFGFPLRVRLNQPLATTTGVYEFLREVHVMAGDEQRPAAAYLLLVLSCFRSCQNVQHLSLTPVFEYNATASTATNSTGTETYPMIALDFGRLASDAKSFDQDLVDDLVKSFFIDLATCVPPVKYITIADEFNGLSDTGSNCMLQFAEFLRTPLNAQTVERLRCPDLAFLLADLARLRFVFPQVKTILLDSSNLSAYDEDHEFSSSDDSYDGETDGSVSRMASAYITCFPNLERLVFKEISKSRMMADIQPIAAALPSLRIIEVTAGMDYNAYLNQEFLNFLTMPGKVWDKLSFASSYYKSKPADYFAKLMDKKVAMLSAAISQGKMKVKSIELTSRYQDNVSGEYVSLMRRVFG